MLALLGCPVRRVRSNAPKARFLAIIAMRHLKSADILIEALWIVLYNKHKESCTSTAQIRNETRL